MSESTEEIKVTTKVITCPRCYLSAVKYLSGKEEGLVFCVNSSCGEFYPDQE